MSLLQRSLICLQTFPATCLPKEHCRSHRKATVTLRQAVISNLCLPPMDIYTKALMVMTLCCMCLQFQLILLSLVFSVPFSPLTWGNILKVRYSRKTFGCMQNRMEIDWMEILTEKKTIWQKGETHPKSRDWCTQQRLPNQSRKCSRNFSWVSDPLRHEHSSDHIQGGLGLLLAGWY